MAKSTMKRNPNLTLAKWVNTSSALATLMFLWSILRQYAPSEFRRFISRFARQLFDVLSPYIELCIDEFSSDENIYKNDDFASIQAYLGEKGSKNSKKLRLLNNMGEKRIFCMDSEEEMTDKFDGITVWWTFRNRRAVSKTSFNRRSYKLSFHRKNREVIAGKYLDYVIKEGKKIREKNRTRRLFLNKVEYCYTPDSLWTAVEFKHPASFDTLAMDSVKKREIIADLLKFRDSEEYYSRIGKAWKRGYLLYGPPGTGKSTMIAAMANLLEYDVYDLELTAVQNNTQLRKLLINTTSKAIIAIEDIDCSLNLTGKRDTNKASTSASSVKTVGMTTTAATSSAYGSRRVSTVTLSGLLNFIDGIWSSLGGERIIVFTTNSVAKLDPALIRAGRMDKHIELSYCGFEGFKVLAKNYLLVEDHSKFDVIKALLEVTKMTPADVAENLLPKFPDDDADVCLENLIRALEKAKEDQEAKEAKRKEKKAKEQAQLELVEKKDDKPEVREEEKETSTTNNEEACQVNGTSNGDN